MIVETLVWLLIVELVGIISLPYVLLIFKNLKERGIFFSKILGFLLLIYAVWILSHLLGYSLLSVSLSFLLITSGSLAILLRKKLDIKLASLLHAELIFLSAFLFFVILRAYNPDISGGEKFMDLAFLSSITRTSSFPPYNPWLSGFPINYYYFGYLFISILTKISSLPTSITFNLAIPLIFALTVSSAYGIGYNLTGRKKYGIAVIIFVALIGNLVGFLWIFCNPHPELCGVFHYAHDYINFKSSFYWSASRVIPYTINEFPFFSFIHADLHPHLFSIPFQLLFIIFLFHLHHSSVRKKEIILGGLLLGFFFPLNSWEYPTYLILLALLLAKNRSLSALFPIIILSILLYLPYHIFAVPSIKGISIVGERTPIQFFLVIFALFLLILFLRFFTWKRILIIPSLLSVIPAFFLDFHLIALIFPLLLFSSFHFLKEKSFIPLLVLAGCLISIFAEIFYFMDGFPHPWERMNTVFKLYLQIWILWGVSAGVALSQVTWDRKILYILIFLIVASFFYTFGAIIERTDGFAEIKGLDGMEYIKRDSPGEYEALRWLRGMEGNPVIVEAYSYHGRTDYSYAARVSSFTGLPTIVGWPGHLLQWYLLKKDIWKELSERKSDVDRIYREKNISSLLKKYQVSYIYFGKVEKEEYTQPEWELPLIFDNGEVQIYASENGTGVAHAIPSANVSIPSHILSISSFLSSSRGGG
jgi:YYY domain-containing protein